MSMPRHRRSGFTLIEILIVAAVFSTLFVVAATVFASIQNRQREVLARQRLVADGRYMLEAMARTLRTERIDYAYYYTSGKPGGDADTGPTSPTTILVTRNSLNVQTCYRQDQDGSFPPIGTGQAMVVSNDCGGSPTWTALTPNDLKIVDFKVLIVPSSNPFLPVPTLSSQCRQDVAGAGGNAATFNSATGVCECEDEPPGSGDPAECFPSQPCVLIATGQPHVCRNATHQPTVTIILTTETATGLNTKIQTVLQTTITTRLYGR